MPLTSYQCKAGGQNVVNTGDHRGIIQLASLREISKYEMKRRRQNVDREGNISKCTNMHAASSKALVKVLPRNQFRYECSFSHTSCVLRFALISATCDAYRGHSSSPSHLSVDLYWPLTWLERPERPPWRRAWRRRWGRWAAWCLRTSGPACLTPPSQWSLWLNLVGKKQTMNNGYRHKNTCRVTMLFLL